MDNQSVENIAKEIVKPNLDLGIDYAELALDESLGEGLLKDVPLVRTLLGIVKTGIAIKERFFIKNFLTFLRTLHSGKINQIEFDKFKNRFDSDKKYREKVTDQVLVLIEKLSSTRKSKVLANLFKAHVEGLYDWERFTALSNCLDKLQEVSYPFLKTLSARSFIMNSMRSVAEIKKTFEARGESFDHMEANGLLTAAGIVYESGTYFAVTKLGQDLYNFGISKVENSFKD